MKINTNYFFFFFCTGCTVLYSGVQPCTVCSIIAQLCRLQPTIARDVLFCTVEYNHVGSVTALLMQITTYCCSGIWRAKFILLHVGMVRGTRYSSLPCCADYLLLTVSRVFWRAMFSQFTRGAGLVHLKPDNCRRERGEGGKAGGVGGSMAFPSLTHPLSHSCFRFLPPNMDIFPNMLSHSFPPNC